MNKLIVLRLLRYTKPYRNQLIMALLCAIVGIAMSLLGPVLIGQAVDQVVDAGQVNFQELLRVLIYFVISIAIGALFQWLTAICTNKASYLTVRDLRTDAFSKLMRLPLKYLDGKPQGELMGRIVTDVDQVSDGLLHGFTQVFSGVVQIIGTLLFMLSIHPLIALVVVLLTPVSLLLASFISKHTHRTFLQQAKSQGELTAYVEEMISGQRVIKAFGRETSAKEGYEMLNKELYRWGLQAQIYPAFTNPLTRFVNGLVFAAVGVTGALAAISGRLSIGQLTSFLSYANQYTKPFNEVTGILAQLQTAASSAARVFELLDATEESPDPSDAPVIKRAAGRVDIQDISFRYDSQRPLIENFRLSVKPGQRIAVVGPTGCGKTTLINLLMRFYEADNGVITVDGFDTTKLTRQNLRAQYGMVLQDTWLQNATVRENIAYGKPDATLDEIMEAAKAAYAHGFILRLEKGYDTVISENGGNLSQGQKQLLCIARVMLLNPPMLILDEATSSIDTRTEIRVQKAFVKMMEGRTSFIVAHRLSTIKEADVILVMDAGKIAEQGKHDELLAKKGFYTRLYESQFAPVDDQLDT